MRVQHKNRTADRTPAGWDHTHTGIEHRKRRLARSACTDSPSLRVQHQDTFTDSAALRVYPQVPTPALMRSRGSRLKSNHCPHAGTDVRTGLTNRVGQVSSDEARENPPGDGAAPGHHVYALRLTGSLGPRRDWWVCTHYGSALCYAWCNPDMFVYRQSRINCSPQVITGYD